MSEEELAQDFPQFLDRRTKNKMSFIQDEPAHTGVDSSPLDLYLDSMRMEANRRGEALQEMPPGPAVLVGAGLSETFWEPRRVEREKQQRELEAARAEAWPRAFQPSEKQLERVEDAILAVRREVETENYMKDRPKRIKAMRDENGRIKAIGVPPKLKDRVVAALTPQGATRDIFSIQQLNDLIWEDIDRARTHMLLQWKAGKQTWKGYRECMELAQEKMDIPYERWQKLHRRLILPPVWLDENVTYRIRSRVRKYLDETFYKMTYHSHGIPQFYDNPRAPRVVPPEQSQPEYQKTPCFQCQARGQASRCRLLPAGCASCQRRGETCLSLNPWDVRAVKRGKLKASKVRGWIVKKGYPETKERNLTEEEQREADWWVKYFQKGRFEQLEWVGGQKGFVKRNVKQDSWALPRFEKDEFGRPERDEQGKPIPFRS